MYCTRCFYFGDPFVLLREFCELFAGKKNGAVNRILGPLGLDQAHAAASTVIL